MKNKEILKVFWKEVEVGQISNPIPDMWYIEGNWELLNTEKSKEFERLAKSLIGKEVMMDHKKGLRIQLLDQNSNSLTHSLVISLEDNLIFIRRFFKKEAVEWLIKNVN